LELLHTISQKSENQSETNTARADEDWQDKIVNELWKLHRAAR
jgi:hypothetical protein